MQGVCDRSSLLYPNERELTVKRKKKAMWFVSTLFLQSVLIVAMGIFTSSRTESLSVIGYGSGIVLSFGSFLGILGLFLEENHKQLLISAIVFLSFGIIAAFFCLTVDGIFTALNIDLRPLHAGRCQYYTSGQNYIYENYFTSVPCQGLTESCSLKVRSGTCYCCDLYNCANGGYLNNYYEFEGVKSCQEVIYIYAMIWVLIALNFSAFILGIITTAILGSFKDMKRPSTSLDSYTQLIPHHSERHSFHDMETQNGLSPTAPLLPQDQETSIVLQPKIKAIFYQTRYSPPML
ncbi:transmembrane protein 255B [Latimeria chalumnae]|uniref:transmembrane protein 255B n=1 Tax=Latimeria chalumnae TaxID=7897 RepID=UPI00313C6C08